MQTLHLDIIAGARPNFMKIASIIEAIRAHNLVQNPAQNPSIRFKFRLIHTGQHYDQNMSGVFFKQLLIAPPDVYLNCGGGTAAEQTAKIMVAYEQLLHKKSTDLCLVVGDVTSTMACAITAQKLGVKVAHVEAGIRSGDWTMPEEINRIVTDSLTNYFFTTTKDAGKRLLKNGVSKDVIFFVGNTMIDTLLRQKPYFSKPNIWETAHLEVKRYFLLTLHRPSNVDDLDQFQALVQAVIDSAQGLPIIFPVHPRTAKNLKTLRFSAPNLHLIEPLGYLEFCYLIQHTKAILTDSGGITEEATVLSVPCMTLRNSTERPETIRIGTNELLGANPAAIAPAMAKLFEGKWKKGGIPPLWDGLTGGRIVEQLAGIFLEEFETDLFTKHALAS